MKEPIAEVGSGLLIEEGEAPEEDPDFEAQHPLLALLLEAQGMMTNFPLMFVKDAKLYCSRCVFVCCTLGSFQLILLD